MYQKLCSIIVVENVIVVVVLVVVEKSRKRVPSVFGGVGRSSPLASEPRRYVRSLVHDGTDELLVVDVAVGVLVARKQLLNLE